MQYKLSELKPMHGHLLVLVDDPIEMYGDLVIPEAYAKRPYTGTIIATSDCWYTKGGKPVATGVKEGQRILFGLYSGVPFDYEDSDITFVDDNGKVYEASAVRYMKEDEILAIITGDTRVTLPEPKEGQAVL